MSSNSIQDILPLIEKPSRYLGSESNCVKKDPSQVKLKIALAFPDLYEIGTSHFGIQILYHILNRHPDIAAERVFAPAEDMEQALRSSGIRLMSMESGTPLPDFDILGFSLLYELNYTNILGMLALAEIPLFAAQRDASHPLVIAGGPCTCNPEPVADFFDAMVIGDGETVIVQMADLWLRYKEKGILNKNKLLNAWSRLKGVYVPHLYQAHRDETGFQTTPLRNPDCGAQGVIRRTILKSLDTAPFPDAPVVPFGKPVHDRLRLEISRGCTRGCRFCQAGMLYRPVRERSSQTLLNLTQACIQNTGYEDISLLSLSTGDYSQITPLIHELMQRYESEHIAVSLPSLRAGTLTPELMKMIKRVRKTGFTFAPEAGTQRLRNVINKNISESEIFDTVANAFAMGWQVVKLYFMIGLPSETQADVAGIVDLVRALRKIKTANGRFGRLNVSVATFIPKPHTPFQWAPQLGLSESKERIAWLKSQLQLPGVQFKWQNPEMSFLEGLWARGDRSFSRLLLSAFQHGCRFDGWSDRFNFSQWEKAIAEARMDTGFYMTRNRTVTEPLPWDHIDIGVTKAFLQKEWQRALVQEPTSDCRWHACHQCGVCDFEKISPEIFHEAPAAPAQTLEQHEAGLNENTLCITYSKTGDARFFGHLEMMNIFLRTLRRAALPLKYSSGYHPMPKVSFEDPLPMGLESLRERFYITVTGPVDTVNLAAVLNRYLPAGLSVTDCRRVDAKLRRFAERTCVYEITLRSGCFANEKAERFHRQQRFNLERTSKKGVVKTIDLKPLVFRLDLVGQNSLSLGIRQTSADVVVRPHDVLSAVFGLSEMEIKQATIIKGTVHV